MKTTEINKEDVGAAIPVSSSSGGYRASDAHTPKMQLAARTGLSGDALSRKALGILHDEKETRNNKVFAIQALARVKSAEAEDMLIRLALKNDPNLAYSVFKTLALTGTAKAFEALASIKSLPYRSLELQRDFAMLLIGYRLQLPGTDQLLDAVLKDAGKAPQTDEEFPLRFHTMKPDEISRLLKQTEGMDYGITLSRIMAYQIDAGGQKYYFCFSNKFDNPADWEKVLRTKHVIGQLFKQEEDGNLVSQQYVVLATPVKEAVQMSFFRKSGELFMLANLAYDREKKSLVVSNVANERAKDVSKAEFRLDQGSFVANLSYIRRSRKRSTTVPDERPAQ